MDKKKNALIFLFFLGVSIFIYRDAILKSLYYGDCVAADVFFRHFHIALVFLKRLSFLWNPYFFGGFPLFADLGYYNLLSPLTILRLSLQYFFPISDIVASNIVYTFYFPLAAFFMYLYARSIGAGIIGAVVGGFIFGLIRRYEYQVPNTYMWFPLVLFFFEKAIARRNINWQYVILAGIFYGIQFLGGGVQYSYCFSIFIIFYILFRFYLKLYGSSFNKEETKNFILACFLIFIIGIGIFAIQLIPTYELAKESARFYFKDFNRAYIPDSFNKDYMKGMVLFNIDYKDTFVGIIPLILALLPLFFKERSKYYYFYLFAAIFFLIMSTPSFINIFLYSHFPYFSFFKKPIRYYYLFIFSLSILVSYGIEKIRHRLIKITLVCLVFVTGCSYWVKVFLDAYPPVKSDDTSVEYLYALNFLDKISDGSRIFLHPGRTQLLRNNLYSSTGASNLVFSRYLELSKTSLDIDMLSEDEACYSLLYYPNYLKLFNIKYIILDKDLRAIDYEEEKNQIRALEEYLKNSPLFEKIYEDNSFYIFQFHQALSRVFFITRALCIQDKQKILGLLKQPSFDPKTTAILEESIDKFSLPGQDVTGGSVQITEYLPSKVEINLKTPSIGFLILLDTYYPGWKAYINDKPAKIYRADYLFRALYIDKPGSYTVKFIYSPFSFKLGATITIITLIGCIGGMIWIRKRG